MVEALFKIKSFKMCDKNNEYTKSLAHIRRMRKCD